MMLKIILKILTLSLLTIGHSTALPKRGNVPIRWSGGAIDWPCESTKRLYIKENKYVNKNVIATRIAIHSDEAILALPRFKPGVAVTLAKISLRSKTDSPILSAFPSWEQQEEGNCDALQSVVDLFLDLHNILWVLDTGIVNSMENPKRTCSPKVVGYDMRTENIVKSVDLGSLTTSHSRLQYIIADHSIDGHIFFYITDASAGAIIVYNVTSNDGYRILLPDNCDTERDVLYPILLRHIDGTSSLLFSYLSGTRIYLIRSKYLKSNTVQGNIVDIGRKSKNIIFLGTDSGTGVFFRYLGKASIYRWDATTSFCNENFDIAYSCSDDCALATQVISDHTIKRMRVLQSNFFDYVQGTVGCGVDHSLIIL